jgi:hypothetical protein
MNRNQDPSGPEANDRKSQIGQKKNIERIALKVNESAESLGVDPVTIRRMIKRGLLKPYRGLRTPLIPVSQIKALIERGEEPK